MDTLKTKKIRTQLQYTAHCTSAGCLFYSYTWLLHSRNTISETAATSGNHATISNLKTAEFPFLFNVKDVVVKVLDTKLNVRTTMIRSPWNAITMNRSHHRSKQPFSRLRHHPRELDIALIASNMVAPLRYKSNTVQKEFPVSSHLASIARHSRPMLRSYLLHAHV